MQKILIVEDETDISDLIMFNLQRAGYTVLQAHDGIKGVSLIFSDRPDLIILDLMLPGRDGYSVFHEIRKDPRTSHIPVIMLTAKSQAEDRIMGLEAGADDYLTKPFSPKELVLRVNNLLQKVGSRPSKLEYEYGPFRFDKNAVRFYLNNEHFELTPTEFKLFLFLCERAQQPQDRNDLLRKVLGYNDEVYSRTLDSHMKRLRQKLGEYGDWIETVRGIGYTIKPPTNE